MSSSTSQAVNAQGKGPTFRMTDHIKGDARPETRRAAAVDAALELIRADAHYHKIADLAKYADFIEAALEVEKK